MNNYESGFLALILLGVVTMVIALGLMVSAVRSPDDARVGLGQRTGAPVSVLAMRIPTDAGAILKTR